MNTFHKKVNLKGKTIDRIDTSTINKLNVYFTDGTSIELRAEISGPAWLPQIWLHATEKTLDSPAAPAILSP